MVRKRTKNTTKSAARGRKKQKSPDLYQFLKLTETQLGNMRESMQDIFKRFEHFSKIFQEQLAKFPAAESPILIQNGALKRKHDVLINEVEEINSNQQDVSNTLARDCKPALETVLKAKKRKTSKSKAVTKHGSENVTKPSSERETEFQPSPSMSDLSGESLSEPLQNNTSTCGPSMPALGEECISKSTEDNVGKLVKVILEFLPQSLLDAAKKNHTSSDDEEDFIEVSPKEPKKVALPKETGISVPKKVVFLKDTVIEPKKKDVGNGSKDVDIFKSEIPNTLGPKKIGKRRNTVCVDHSYSKKQVQPSAPLDNSIRVHGRVFGPSFVVASPDTRKKILDKQNDVLPSPEFGSKRNAHTDNELTTSTNAGSSSANGATKHKKIEVADVLKNRSVNNFQRYFQQVTAENELKEAAKRNNALKNKPADATQGYKLPE